MLVEQMERATVEERSAEWWCEEEGKVWEAAKFVVERIRNQQSDRMELALHHARLWGDSDLVGLTGYEFARRTTRVSTSTQNVTRNMVGAVTSRITKNRPKPTFLPNGGTTKKFYQLHQKSKKLEKAVAGCFYAGNLYGKAPVVYRDALIFGTGFIRAYPDTKRMQIRYERCLEWDVLVDEEEAQLGEPRSMHYQKPMDRRVLIAEWAKNDLKLQRAIMDAPDARPQNMALVVPYASPDRRVIVTESWHLPSGPNEEDGIHAIWFDGGDLLVEPWKIEQFPIVPIYWQKPLLGYRGDGLVSELASQQIQINKTLSSIQTAHDMSGKGYWLVQNGSDVVPGKLSNNAGTVIRYTGVAPQFYVPGLISPEMYPFLDGRVRAAYETSGISQLAATSQKPAGLNSGEAIRAYSDEQSERFIDAGRSYEEWFIAIADVTVSLLKMLAELAKEEGKEFHVKSRSKNFVEQIPWDDVDMEDDSYDVQVFPASMLPQTPAGRLAFVNDLMRFGMDPDDALELIDISDVEQYTDLRLSARRSIDRRLEKIIASGQWTSPEPFDNASYGLARGRERLHWAEEMECPESTLKLLRDWCVECWRLTKQPDPMAAAFGDTPPGIDPAAAGMPPGGPPPPPGLEGMPPGGMPPPGAGPPMPAPPPMGAVPQ